MYRQQSRFLTWWYMPDSDFDSVMRLLMYWREQISMHWREQISMH